jgi:hypothetical protein
MKVIHLIQVVILIIINEQIEYFEIDDSSLVNEINRENLKSIDFETLGDYNFVNNYYSYLGLTFEGAVTLSQGKSLNYLNFPPRSGINVIYDYPDHSVPGNITITFNTSKTGNVYKVGGYVTGNRNVSMTAFSSGGSSLGYVETGGAN